MTKVDRPDPRSLDQRTGQLWVLALTTILVLATGLALLMYVVVFSKPVGKVGHTNIVLFLGYCVLVPLTIAYLYDRSLLIRRLRRAISEEKEQIMYLQREIRENFLEMLPGVAHFQDRLAMEYRRASRANQPISLLIVGVKPSTGVDAPSDVTAVFGDAAKALARKLRGEDSIYYFEDGVFGILLPTVPTGMAHRVMKNLQDSLQETAGPDSRFTFESQVTNYPENAASAREMEQAVRNVLLRRGNKAFQPQRAESTAKVTQSS